MSDPSWIEDAWNKPLSKPPDRTPKFPLTLTEEEGDRVLVNFEAVHQGRDRDLLLIEILLALRAIDDKLAKLLERKE